MTMRETTRLMPRSLPAADAARGRPLAFAHGSSTPPPPLLADASEGRFAAAGAMPTGSARTRIPPQESLCLRLSVAFVSSDSNWGGARGRLLRMSTTRVPAALNTEVLEKRRHGGEGMSLLFTE